MAFWREALVALGGFDTVFETAGDDVDVCWRLLNRGWEIGFHPAAVVWHHRRASARAYLRQQRAYGRSEALVEARHPERFTGLGTARWLGTIYTPSGPRGGSRRVYRGPFGVSPFQSVYRRESHGIDIANQLGVPLGVVLALSAPLGALAPTLLWPAAIGVAILVLLGAVNIARARPPVNISARRRARCTIAALTMGQPLVRAWGRTRNRAAVLQSPVQTAVVPRPTGRGAKRVLVYDADRDRAALATALIVLLRAGGLPVVAATGWEDHDARFGAGPFVRGEMITSDYPSGCIQVRVRRRVRASAVVAVVIGAGEALSVSGALFAAVVATAVLATLHGLWRTGPLVDRLLGGGRL
jgi:hypothetical protein